MDLLNKKIIRCLIMVLFLSCMHTTAQGQNHNIIGSFPFYDNIDYSYFTDIITIEQNYYFCIYHFDWNSETECISIIKTDMNFNVLARHDSIKISNTLQGASRFININNDAGYILMAGRQFKKDKFLFNIFKLNLQTLEVQRTDSIRLLTSELDIATTYFKQINDTTIVAFGAIENSKTLYINQYVFLAVSTSGKIKNYKELGLGATVIFGFEYLEKPELYFVNASRQDYYVFDKNLNLVQRVEDEYYAAGIKLLNARIKSRFMEAREGYIHCIGRVVFWSKQYSITHLRFPILGDSIGEADQVDPLCETDAKFNPEFVIPAVDNNGNVLIVLDDQFSFPRQYAIDTTTLYILKTNYKDYKYRENEWFIVFNDNKSEISIGTAEADNNGDFIIAGCYWQQEFYGTTRNFYLKVQSDGTITATKGPVPENIMVVYPNPTYGPLFLKGDENKVSMYSVYNIQGQLLMEAEMTGNGSFEIDEMSAGTYFLIFKDRNGKICGKSRVVKY